MGSIVSVAVGGAKTPGVVALAVAVLDIVVPASISAWVTV